MNKNVCYKINQSFNLQRYHLRMFRLSFFDLGRAAALTRASFVIISGSQAL